MPREGCSRRRHCARKSWRTHRLPRPGSRNLHTSSRANSPVPLSGSQRRESGCGAACHELDRVKSHIPGAARRSSRIHCSSIILSKSPKIKNPNFSLAMEGQFFGGAGMQQQQQFVAPPQQSPVAAQQPFGSLPAPPHFQYGYVSQQPFPPYIATAAAAPPPPPPPPPPIAHNSFFNPWEMPPTPVPPPQDSELHKRIDKLVEFYVKNGPGFEALMKEKQKENPDYAFLFGADGHSYYQYKLWITINPHLVAFNPALNMVNQAIGVSAGITPPPPPPPPPPSAAAAASSFPAFFDLAAAAAAASAPPVMHHPQQQFFDPALATAATQIISSEMVAELHGLLDNLSGTKEAIKNARNWFVQRSTFAPTLVEVLRDRVTKSDGNVDSQMNILYLVNDILFSSLQSRLNTKELDGVALAFRPVLSSILVAIYQNPRVNDAEREQVEKMLQFWRTKEVYDPDTVYSLDKEMRFDSTGGRYGEKTLPPPEPERDEDHQLQSSAASFPAPPQSPSVASLFPALAPFLAAQAPSTQTQQPAGRAEQAPYPFFPPGLIPGMVRKMQIGSGVPYSPLSPLDIPTIIPSSATSESHIMDRVSKFFKEIGEPDPLAGKYKPSGDSDDEGGGSGGARIPPPPQMQQVDPQTGTLPDGSLEHRPGMTSTGRLGLGAAADPNEATQYDDVYTSYRKQRSTNYHTSLSARAAAAR
ncbi:calcium homeostasis endoplasmic reticulum protein isoform X2 [Selaginella moellendorffii]|uniref:calcium homeostasis endoplasmic reticulum protein isoform X2 n=1 Tax=Selaginella moellendorffii TaxID=88036 RepID=UPI000D1C789B|nr:calcium homeostasis endoplasmic reticulum protein isoform X2 [Selaginella moellendorffii]|eukprot:XP_024517616.1 calcium homeostasis endoplasmic reticulum protein isoform X2 [Selaginella moellendorffii]